MPKISGSEAVIKCLINEGIEIIYGYPGGAIMPVYDELFKYQDKIHHVLTRHGKVQPMLLRVLQESLVRLVLQLPHLDLELQTLSLA